MYSTKNIRINKGEATAYFLILSIAGLSTILRLSIESNWTLFRVLLPFITIYLYTKIPTKILVFFGEGAFLLIYSFFISIYVSRFHNFDLVFCLHYIVILFFYIFVRYTAEKVGVTQLYNYLLGLYKIMIVLALIQLVFGGVYFNTQNRLPQVNIFFWNENEFSAVLGAFIPLYFLKGKRGMKKIIWICLGIFLIIHSDARLVLIALSLFFVFYFVSLFPLLKNKILGLIGVLLTCFLFLFFFKDQVVVDNITVGALVLNPINQIIALDPIYNVGSMANRVNAVIFGFQELVNSYFLGIGPGNSILMMEEKIIPGMELYSAYSMHNIIFQTITELGILGIIYLILLFREAIKSVKLNKQYPRIIVLGYYVSLIISISMLSGAYGNYFFLLIFFFAISFFSANPSST